MYSKVDMCLFQNLWFSKVFYIPSAQKNWFAKCNPLFLLTIENICFFPFGLHFSTGKYFALHTFSIYLIIILSFTIFSLSHLVAQNVIALAYFLSFQLKTIDLAIRCLVHFNRKISPLVMSQIWLFPFLTHFLFSWTMPCMKSKKSKLHIIHLITWIVIIQFHPASEMKLLSGRK